MKKFIFALLSLALLTSCKKDKTPVDIPRGETYLIKSETSNDKVSAKFLYNSDNKITEHQTFYFYERYTYDKLSRLIKREASISASSMDLGSMMLYNEIKTAANSPINFYTDFVYSDNRLIKTINYSKDAKDFKMVSYQTFEYSNNKIKRKNLFTAESKLTQFTTFGYDVNGNVIEEKSYSYLFSDNGQPNLISESFFKFDDKPNPFRIFKELGEPGLFTNSNNIIETTGKSYVDLPVRISTTKTTYEYNVDGYPVKPINESGQTYITYNY